MGLDNPLHIAFIVVIVLLVFGAKRLPELGRSLGAGMREFKQAITGESHNPGDDHSPSESHDRERPTLPAGTPQAPDQTPPPAQDALAQRDPAASDRH
jgi:sec-independent protein translocase protein TatA